MRRPAAELATAAVAGLLTALLVRALIGASHFYALSKVAPGLGPLWAGAMLAIAVGAHFAGRRSWLPVAVLAGVAAGMVMTPLMAGLHGTDQPLFSIARGDMEFRTEYVTRFASTWHLDDYTFRGLHAFYPPGWFWVAGRTAHVLGIAPWRIMAPFTIATIGVALLTAYGLWRVVLPQAAALSAAIGSALVLPAQVGRLAPGLSFTTTAWYSSYSCFVAVTGVAWVAATLHTLRRRPTRGRLVLLTLAGAVLALTYYLLFIVLVATLLVLVAFPREGRREALRRAGALCGGMALLTAVFWVPFLAAVAGGSSSQGHYVVPEFLHVSVGLDGPVALALLTVVAIVTLIGTRLSLASRAVGGVLAATVLYQALSVATLLVFHDQLQPHRAVTMMWAAFGAAVPVTLAAFGPRWPRLPRAATAALAAVAIFALGAAQGTDLASGPLAAAAHVRPDVARAGAMTRFITQTTGKRPAQLTVLTSYHLLLITQPFYGFLPLRARYAHPEADVAARLEVIETAGACRTPACATRALTTSRFGAVDAAVLGRTPSGYQMEADEDAFPRRRTFILAFRPENFDPAVWAKRAFGRYTVFARRPGH